MVVDRVSVSLEVGIGMIGDDVGVDCIEEEVVSLSASEGDVEEEEVVVSASESV